MARREKRAPLGICDLCGGEIPPSLGWYTSKRRPRLHCSLVCRQTENSRVGSPVRSRKAMERVRSGQWVNPNPALGNDPAAIAQWRANFTRALSAERKREVAEGRWRNPALDPAAREKLSRPRRHTDNPVLHRAVERLGAGASVADLTEEEKQTWREYRRRLQRERAHKQKD